MVVIQTPLQTNAHRCRYNTHQLTLHDLDRKRFVEETVMTFSDKDVNKPWPFSFSGSFSKQGQRKPDQFRTFPSEVTTIWLFPLICGVQNIVSINCLIRVISGGRRDLKNGGNWGEGFPVQMTKVTWVAKVSQATKHAGEKSGSSSCFEQKSENYKKLKTYKLIRGDKVK